MYAVSHEFLYTSVGMIYLIRMLRSVPSFYFYKAFWSKRYFFSSFVLLLLSFSLWCIPREYCGPQRQSSSLLLCGRFLVHFLPQIVLATYFTPGSFDNLATELDTSFIAPLSTSKNYSGTILAFSQYFLKYFLNYLCSNWV